MHPEALTAEQREVLMASREITERWGAYLAGGTALALQLGHRRSVDLDWFTRQTVKPVELAKDLESTGFAVTIRQNNEGTFLGRVGSIQYSVFRYRYELATPPVDFEGCRLASLTDIAAMKMTAIVQRATKRDYVDLHALLSRSQVSVDRVISAMKQKFLGIDPRTALRALTYFKDVEKQAMPDMIAKTTWEDVKRELLELMSRWQGKGDKDR